MPSTSKSTATFKFAGSDTLLLASSITAFVAGKVQNTSFVPAEKFTALFEFDDVIIVVLANAPADTVPRPTSNSAFA